MKKSKGLIEYEKKFNRIAKKLYGNQANQSQKEPEKEVINAGKLLNEDLERKEVPKEVGTKVSIPINCHKLTLKQYLSLPEKSENEITKTKTEKKEVFEDEKENKVVERQEIVEKNEPEQKEEKERKDEIIVERQEIIKKKEPGQKKEEVDEKEEKERKDEIVDDGNLPKDILDLKVSDFILADYETGNSIQGDLSPDILKKTILLIQDEVNMFINSTKFKYIENLHHQIITGEENGNSVYNRFGINSNIINDYKQYYSQLVNLASTNLFDIGQIDFKSINETIENILTDIYTKLYGNNELKDIDYIKEALLNEDINSDENIKGNNILKILANLAAVFHDCYCSFLLVALGPKFSVGNITILGKDAFIAVNQIKTIMKGLGIEIQIEFRN